MFLSFPKETRYGFLVDTHIESYAKHTLKVTGESKTCLSSSWSQSCFLDPKLIKQKLASFFLEVQIENILGLQALWAQAAHYSLPAPSLKGNLHMSSEVL